MEGCPKKASSQMRRKSAQSGGVGSGRAITKKKYISVTSRAGSIVGKKREVPIRGFSKKNTSKDPKGYKIKKRPKLSKKCASQGKPHRKNQSKRVFFREPHFFFAQEVKGGTQGSGNEMRKKFEKVKFAKG